jgi:hypothetical protein
MTQSAAVVETLQEPPQLEVLAGPALGDRLSVVRLEDHGPAVVPSIGTQIEDPL